MQRLRKAEPSQGATAPTAKVLDGVAPGTEAKQLASRIKQAAKHTVATPAAREQTSAPVVKGTSEERKAPTVAPKPRSECT